jgi:hypothetical protein
MQLAREKNITGALEASLCRFSKGTAGCNKKLQKMRENWPWQTQPIARIKPETTPFWFRTYA